MFASTESTIIIWYIYLSIITCVWMHRCECVVISLSYKCRCILICTYAVNEVNLNLFVVWPRSFEPLMGARMVPANGHWWVQEWCQQMDKLQKLKKYFICPFGWKDFPSYFTNIYICVQFLFSKRGACFYWVPCFYWDIYGICIDVLLGFGNIVCCRLNIVYEIGFKIYCKRNY